MQSGWTAGPDGVREPRPHHSSGIDVPMKRQASLGCVGSTDCAITRHYSLASLQHWRRGTTKPPRPWAGIDSGASLPPRRCAPSCSLARPLRPAAAAADAARSPTDRLWSRDLTYEGRGSSRPRNLKGRAGDAANVILSAAGYNLRLVLAWLRIILRVILLALLQTSQFGQPSNRLLNGRLSPCTGSRVWIARIAHSTWT